MNHRPRHLGEQGGGSFVQYREELSKSRERNLVKLTESMRAQEREKLSKSNRTKHFPRYGEIEQ